MFYWLYERLILSRIQVLPRHICFMISGADLAAEPGKCREVTGWCSDFNAIIARRPRSPGTAAPPAIQGITFHINELSSVELNRILPKLRDIASMARLELHHGTTEEVLGTGLGVVVAIGKSGREEITDCIRRLAQEGVQPTEIDEKMLESCLTFRYDPDIVVKTGGDHLTDFLIWQSVYSELFFSDVNWKYFRRVDFLRVLRDYQARIRRFGK
ncbi:Di-trans-poly-cis-decaprenylcistransferase [Methanoregula boonei 6A8]|uniref:Di-trans-poly-cis-decaprenylcistransferase n=1 Tax=Methanoregula boonei (strain DSM 21154 / JCM 14090 / 6A8) TaxID=456442 RepID=A7IA18_METB6|nr:undecaprenyl diphosphate synthase family protein [Methanoregula boonei]ABS56579.1 Di-trans-poly-cis-decaprenylcistransferase [Methanoregula boonei 6A8]